MYIFKIDTVEGIETDCREKYYYPPGWETCIKVKRIAPKGEFHIPVGYLKTPEDEVIKRLLTLSGELVAFEESNYKEGEDSKSGSVITSFIPINSDGIMERDRAVRIFGNTDYIGDSLSTLIEHNPDVLLESSTDFIPLTRVEVNKGDTVRFIPYENRLVLTNLRNGNIVAQLNREEWSQHDIQALLNFEYCIQTDGRFSLELFTEVGEMNQKSTLIRCVEKSSTCFLEYVHFINSNLHPFRWNTTF